MAPRVETLSRTELAAAFGATVRTVQNWRAAGMPARVVSGAPRFVLRECIAWRVETVRAEERERARAGRNGGEMELRKLAAEAELKELQLAEKRRDVVPVTEYRERIETFVGGFVATAAGQLHRFEREILMATGPADARKLTQRMHAALMEGAQTYADTLEAEADALEGEAA